MAAMHTGGGATDWAAAGAVGPNASYRNQTLQYRDVELAFDESVAFSTIKRLWFAAAAFSTLVFLVVGVLPALFAGSFDALSPGLVISFVVFWLTLLLTRLNEPISEWKTLLEEKAAASSSAYAAIYGALARRHIPLSAVPARVRSDITPEVVHNRLVITSGRYVAYVTVFAYGTSLYVGWTMWRSRPGFVVIGHFLKDILGSFVNRAGNLNQMLRTDRPRAMREAVHSAAREGVEIAVQGIEVPLASTFGQEIPIQDVSSAAGPVPPAPPSPPTPVYTPGPIPGGPVPSPGPMHGMPPVNPTGPSVTPPPQSPYTTGWNGS